MRALQYAFDEAVISLGRSGRSAAMAIGAITIAFVVLGGFLLVLSNLQRVVEDWATAAELSVYLHDEVSDEERDRLAERLAGDPGVSGVEFVSKERALDRFQRDFPELASVAASLEENPFPASFEVRLRGGDADEAAALASIVARDEAVADVRYDRRWLTRLAALLAGVRVAGLVVAAVLVLGAAFTVMAVVRLSLEARRDEIDIMLLVGAPFAYLRGPFVMEGVLQGGLGAGLAILALWVGHLALGAWLDPAWQAVAGTGPVQFLGAGQVLLVLTAGLGVGGAAGAVASRGARQAESGGRQAGG
jgi:cell division transport system permease protein